MPELTPQDEATETLSPAGIAAGGGAGLSLTVAAYNATAAEIAAADYVCDGVADDVQINSAIAAATASGYGGAVTLSSGQFRVAAAIILPNTYGFSLVGQGREVTQVKAASALNDSVIKLPYNFATVAALTIDGNSTQNASGNGILITGYKCTIDAVNISGAKDHGISVSGTSGAPAYSQRLQHLFIISCGQDGVNFTSYCYDSHITDVWVGSSGRHGIYSDSGTQIFTSCHLWGNQIDGLRLNSGENSQVLASYLETNGQSASGGRGLRTGSAAYNLVVTGCNIWKNSSGGVYLFESDYATLTGNTITDNGGSGHAAGITLDASYNVVIIGNSFYNEHTSAQGRPVVEQNGSDYTVYTGNMGLAADHFTGAADITGSHSINENNAGNSTLTGHKAATAAGEHVATAVSFAATGNIVATNVQAAIAEVDVEKQTLIVPGYRSGSWYTGPSVGGQAISDLLLTEALAYYCPLYISKTVSVTAIGVVLKVNGGAAEVVRVGILNDDGFGAPSTVLLDGATVSVSAGASVIKSVTANLTLTPGLYWSVVVAQGASGTPPTLAAVDWYSLMPTEIASSTSVTALMGYTLAGVTGSLATTSFGALTKATAKAPAFIFKPA